LLADLNHEGMTILMTTHDLNAAASHLPWVICLNKTIVAQGEPDDVFVPEILNATYNGDMIVVRQGTLIFVQERPHHHCVHDLHPHPVLSHPSQDQAIEEPVEELTIDSPVETEVREPLHGHPVSAV
jgi:ABC-type cobalamin/Fe3+-siderophores transport system ATPase subunit